MLNKTSNICEYLKGILDSPIVLSVTISIAYFINHINFDHDERGFHIWIAQLLKNDQFIFSTHYHHDNYLVWNSVLYTFHFYFTLSFSLQNPGFQRKQSI